MKPRDTQGEILHEDKERVDETLDAARELLADLTSDGAEHTAKKMQMFNRVQKVEELLLKNLGAI